MLQHGSQHRLRVDEKGRRQADKDDIIVKDKDRGFDKRSVEEKRQYSRERNRWWYWKENIDLEKRQRGRGRGDKRLKDRKKLNWFENSNRHEDWRREVNLGRYGNG